jgi:hypothetical protein
MHGIRMMLVAGVSIIASSAAGAQLRRTAVIPAGYQPPAGLCRVWYQGLAPQRQPAPTDCNTARSRLTANSFLVYGGQGPQQTARNGGGRYDTGRTGQGGWNMGVPDRGGREGRYDRESEQRARKAQHEREKAWKREHKHDDRNGDDEDNRADGNRGEHGDRGEHGNRDEGGYQRGSANSGRGANSPGGWFPNGNPAQGCVDANRDGICDVNQRGRVRTP